MLREISPEECADSLYGTVFSWRRRELNPRKVSPEVAVVCRWFGWLGVFG